jgi:hypothetical protein
MEILLKSFDTEEYTKQVKYLKSNSARILNNVFHVNLRKVSKKKRIT